MKRIFFSFVFLISYFLFLISAPSAQAQLIDIAVAPPIFQVQITPPADAKAPFVLRNFTDSEVELKISIKPFSASKDENGQLEYTDNPELEDPYLFDRIRVLDNDLPVDSITLSAQETKDLILEFKIPINEPKGEYYFSLVFSTVPQIGSDSNLTQASAAVSSNVLLSIGPLGKKQGLIEEFSTPLFMSKGPVPFNVRLNNKSDHFITIKGDIIIENVFGQAVGKVKLLPVNILANSIRRIPDILQSGTASEKDYGKIKKIVEKNSSPVAIWPENFLLGPYKATLTIALSDQGPVYKRTIRFFAFPLEYLLAILIIISIVIYIILRVKKKLSIIP